MATRTIPDISDLGFWRLPPEERMAGFAALRRLDKPVFVPELKVPFIKHGPGYHALVRHADVVEASRNPEIFSSEPAANSILDMPRWLSVYFGSMINMDDPKHAKIRRVVSRAFTPKVLAKMESDLAGAAARIVDDVVREGPRDFVAQVAARLPVQVICDMMGIPERHHEMVLHRTNVILGNTDSEYTGIEYTGTRADFGRLNVARGLLKLMLAGNDLHRLAMRLGARRRREPADDLTSALVNANVDGERLTDQQLGSFFILLVAAGNETTRNAIAHGLKLFTDHPDQRELLMSDYDRHIGGAIEEIVRYSTPVIHFRRTLTRDHGHYRKGDKVVLFYNSANRDEDVFENPDEFDITRSPNPHVGFGGPGPHYCLGANLARREITVMFRELFTRLPGIRTTGEPDRLFSNFINGVKRQPYTF
ncbi:cytochrome P450 [Bailinhaonella thermotolerans]|uniref:Cytochrome P450 n=1 Tax=Bailinhaonella thermotolerans TaxID=1070861 RepID=A0A3A4B893_9ACTN|nr:cytochrome P450 [Bailinhaonella thermotolerans]RJL34451.1 cytochrome P450 [Bailinhaonella thermotolerans]